MNFDQHHNEQAIDNTPPKFRFVSSPAANVGEVFYAITIGSNDLPKLNSRDWAFMKKIESQARVHVKVPSKVTQHKHFGRSDFMASQRE